jgi:hypothetical protein
LDLGRLPLTWWKSADASSLNRAFACAIVIAGTRCILALVGIDSLNTIDYRGAPITIGISIAATSAMFLSSLRAYFGPSEQLQRNRRIHSWAVKRGASEIPLGTLICGILALVTWWASSGLMGILAQYVPATTSLVTVTVTSDLKVETPRSPCRRRLIVRTSPPNPSEDFDLCAATTFGAPIETSRLSIGDLGVAELRATPFGRAIVRIDAKH